MFREKKRLFTRIQFDRQVHLEFVERNYENCQLKDLNLTGMFVFGTFTRQVDETCFLVLDQKGESSDLSLQASARVVRTTDDGIAIAFTSMTFESYMFLQATLLYEAGDPITIGLEFPENCPFEIIKEEESLPYSTFNF